MLKLVRLFIGKPCVAPSSDQKVQTRTTQRLLLDISQPNKVCTDYTFRLLQTYLSLALSRLISDWISKKSIIISCIFHDLFFKMHSILSCFNISCCMLLQCPRLKYLFFNHLLVEEQGCWMTNLCDPYRKKISMRKNYLFWDNAPNVNSATSINTSLF